MPTGWQTYPIELRGGLVSNISPLQHGMQQPGSARALTNFEPSVEGGYRRIKGFSKYDTASVPLHSAVVQGTASSGTTLYVADLMESPSIGNTLTIAGVSGTYTVQSVTYSTLGKSATIGVAPALASAPADKADITFTNSNTLIRGLAYFQQRSVVQRNGIVYRSEGTGWTKISVPAYGSALVNGAGQSGTTLVIDGLTDVPQAGDTFTVAGVTQVYTLIGAPSVTAGAATLTITPALASSPADNAAITFRTANRSSATKLRFARHNMSGSSTIVAVDGANKPFKYSGSTFTTITSAPTDVVGASHVAEFKQHMFYAKGNLLTFTAPYTDDDFSVANGSGTILLPHDVTGLIVFREQLIIFNNSKTYRLTGNTVSDFSLQPISLDIGCTKVDSIQEVGGDIMFVATDGIRLLSATDRVGDFGLAVASRPIQNETMAMLSSNTDFCSIVVREKNQYRLFGYADSIAVSSSRGIIAVQMADQTAEGMAWAETAGIKAFVATSIYSAADEAEVILFAHKDGYVYRMESGKTFDGTSIKATFYTPYLSITDPRIRKTLYKSHTYVDSLGSVTGVMAPKFDFDPANAIQPSAVTLASSTGDVAFYGTALFGAASFGGKPTSVFSNQLVGSGFTVSLQYTFTGEDLPFSLDAIVLEYAAHDRQ